MKMRYAVFAEFKEAVFEKRLPTTSSFEFQLDRQFEGPDDEMFAVVFHGNIDDVGIWAQQ